MNNILYTQCECWEKEALKLDFYNICMYVCVYMCRDNICLFYVYTHNALAEITLDTIYL